MARKYRLDEIHTLKNMDIFFDTNVLIYIFWPTASYVFETNYSKALRNLQKQKNKLYISFIVISEAINRMLRIEYKKYTNYERFKDFRHSYDGRQALDDIYTIVKNDILNSFEIMDKAFNKEEIENLLEMEDADINDLAIESICKENNMILLTNDSDFKHADIDLLSCNNKLF
jgi:predicted nucleic acid-binding protein